jgi:TonB family protein
MKTLRILPALLVLPALAGTAAAQDLDLVDRAKVQYESAAYEDALTILNDAAEIAPTSRVQVEQYRALCFIALGRVDEAQRAIAALVATDPTYIPSASVASPKVLSIVADIRKREVPAIVRRLMEEGRTAYQRKELPTARQRFELALKLLSDPAMAARPETEDLTIVARGFFDLTGAVEAAAPPPPPTPSTPTAEVPAAPATNDVFVPAIPIQQNMPSWEPPGRAFASIEYIGSIKVRIGTDGRVLSVSIERPSHPAYDARLLQVAPSWRYKPATRNGAAVESEKVIGVRLQPPTD